MSIPENARAPFRRHRQILWIPSCDLCTGHYPARRRSRREATVISAWHWLKKPRSTMRATITQMIAALVPTPDSLDISIAPEREDRDRVRV